MVNQEIDKYIESFPLQTQKKLQELRKIIQKAAPMADEVISYKMPAYNYLGMLVYFAGYKNHIGFYPTGSGIAAFQDKLNDYVFSKGTIQFELDRHLPVKLITEIMKFRIQQNEAKQKPKKIKSSKTEGPAVFHSLSAPAQRALSEAGINTLKKLSLYTEVDLLNLHGFGPSSIPKVIELLAVQNLCLKQ